MRVFNVRSIVNKKRIKHYGTARHGTARHGTARHGTARHGTARHGTARHIDLHIIGITELWANTAITDVELTDRIRNI